MRLGSLASMGLCRCGSLRKRENGKEVVREGK